MGMANPLNPFNWFTNTSQNQDQDRQEDLNKAVRKAAMADRVGDTYSRKTDNLAVSTVKPDWYDNSTGDSGFLGYWGSPSFREFLTFGMSEDKRTRLQDYRDLGNQEKLEGCIHEYAISCIASHDNDDAVKGKLEGDYDEEIKGIVNKEIRKVIEFFKFDDRGQKYFKEFLKTGELAFENVFSYKKPELGILDVKAIPPENIEPIFRNEYNEEIEGFVLFKPSNQNNNGRNSMGRVNRTTPTFDTIPLACSQVTYCSSGDYDEVGMKRLVKPYVLKGQNAQKQLSLIEDAIVINAMTNGPERLLWQFPVGNMSPAEKNRYMTNIINGIKKKKGTDGKGNILDKFDPISITEDYYVPVDKDGNSAKVERIQGSQAFSSGFNGILTYFHQKVYEDMHVPITRLNPDAAQSDGQTITMQELAFAERVIEIQKRFAEAVKKTVITHLKLKGIKLHNESCKNAILTESKQVNEQTLFTQHVQLIERNYYGKILRPSCSEEEQVQLMHDIGESYWDQYELQEVDIKIKFSLPTTFLTLREQQQFDLKWNNFSNMANSGFFSVYLLAKEHLDFSDDDIKKHLSWRNMEAKKTWEVTQISENGPEFRELAQAEAGVGGGGLGGGDSALGDFGGGGDLGGGDVPEFGEGEEGLDDLGAEEPVEEPTEEPVEEPTEEPEV